MRERIMNNEKRRKRMQTKKNECNKRNRRYVDSTAKLAS